MSRKRPRRHHDEQPPLDLRKKIEASRVLSILDDIAEREARTRAAAARRQNSTGGRTAR